MSRKTRAYTDITTIEDLKRDIVAYPQYVDRGFLTLGTIQKALQSFNDMDEQTTTRFFNYLHHIDRRMSCPGTANANRFHKVPNLLIGAIYLTYYPDTVAQLNNDELMFLSSFSIPEPLSFYETATTTWTKDLLGTLSSLSDDYMQVLSYMEYANHKLDTGTSSEEVATYLRETPIETLKQETRDYETTEFEKGALYL